MKLPAYNYFGKLVFPMKNYEIVVENLFANIKLRNSQF